MKTKEIIDILTQNIACVIKGKEKAVKLFISAFLANGHVLIDDVPGVGKTSLVKALSKLIKNENNTQIEFKRIQCTPDLLPYDITGVDVFNAKTQEFEFIHGPVFCDIFLADELNRTPPKVQSALLEAMEERQITVNGKTHKLKKLFFTAATQNPIETLGTYPLPPAQLDRFMILLSLGYPDDDAALKILSGNSSSDNLSNLEPVVTVEDVFASRKEQETVFCHHALLKAIIDICNATRNHPEIELGASPRASLQLLQLAKVTALANGRSWVEDYDLNNITPYVISHKCVYKNGKYSNKDLIKSITETSLQAMNKNTDWSKP